MPTHQLFIMGLWRDSFEAQTDRMSPADAQSVLLDRVRAAQEKISPGSTSSTPGWVNAPKGESLQPNDDPLAGVGVLLREIENLLAPRSQSFWRLQLGQRRRGARVVPSAITEDILRVYEGELALEHHPTEPERARPKKVIIGDLAKEYGLTDATVRGIIRRASGKKTKRKATR